jgi:hypothetical protein
MATIKLFFRRLADSCTAGILLSFGFINGKLWRMCAAPKKFDKIYQRFAGVAHATPRLSFSAVTFLN